ncbi:MAG TPA: ABC transporter ATP-binding protein [Gammaproteobacteria bacterium]|jgi:ABC-type branched-subunit amino acid transport system ATPase component|nr:ABC transporter ATP-binding protein [Gammaproteobacteria bacterium]|tara:strand:- start:391 stop:1146 length:756 start_codon:yes stop_codon:yes gene_type:complete
MSDSVLQAVGLCKNFGALEVAHNIDFTLKRGARHALIGPNGAGKTTFINLITGVLMPSSGQIILNGQDITGLGQAERSRRGIARTFQINQLFRGLTVLENVVLAIAERQGIASAMFRPLSSYSEVTDEAMELLSNFDLNEDALRRIDELPYGRQRLVEIVIALGQRPSVLLLDEPAAGIPSSESQHILDAASALSSDITVLIIEHDMEIVFSIADYITVLVSGAVLTEGEPEAIAADERVRAVYLGEVDRG